MKILLISTSDKVGGAAIACYRLFCALQKQGLDVNMLVLNKLTENPNVFQLNTNFIKKKINFVSFCLERLQILFYLRFKKKNLFQISLDNYGAFGLLNHPLIKDADVVNFHWTSQAMMSLKQMETIVCSGKKVVFTMHDMHYFTSICHYASDCTNFSSGCGHCSFIACGEKSNDLSSRWFKRKQAILGKKSLTFVACSEWLALKAQLSLMLKNATIINIPNPIDTSVYKSVNKIVARKKYGIDGKYVLLFGAFKITDERKGFDYLKKALDYIHKNNPKLDNDINLLIFGQGNSLMFNMLPYKCILAGYLTKTEDIVNVYSASDVYIIPSLEDNLPNTVVEALSCSLPCVSFNTGGLPQLINHLSNGYLANYKDYIDLAHGILHIIKASNYDSFCKNARKKAEDCFSEQIVVQKYYQVYNS